MLQPWQRRYVKNDKPRRGLGEVVLEAALQTHDGRGENCQGVRVRTFPGLQSGHDGRDGHGGPRPVEMTRSARRVVVWNCDPFRAAGESKVRTVRVLNAASLVLRPIFSAKQVPWNRKLGVRMITSGGGFSYAGRNHGRTETTHL